MAIIDLVGASAEMAQKSLSSQVTYNWYLKKLDQTAKSALVMVPTPGAVKKLQVKPTADDCRGLYYSSSGPSPSYAPRLYGVWGTEVFRFNESLTAKYPIGTIRAGVDPVGITDNGFVLAIADGEDVWTYPLSSDDGDANVLKTTLLPELPGFPGVLVRPTHIAFLSQRLIINSTLSNQWFFSSLASAEVTWGSTDFYSAESSSDSILSLMVSNGSLWLYGYRSYEIWRPNDNQDDPYSYVAGSQSSVGIVAPNSTATIHNYIFWLGGSDVGAAGVYMGNSTSAERISTPGIEDQISKISDQTDAIGWCYSWKGFMHYILSFPSANKTFCYETQTGSWTNRALRDIASGDWLVYPYQYGVFSNGQIVTGLIGGHDSWLCQLSDDAYTEFDGRAVVRQRITQVYFEEYNLVKANELTIDMEVGTTPVIVSSDTGGDPKIMLEVSRDGGNTYGIVSEKSLGLQGDYRKVVRWNSLGTSRAFTFRFTIAEPIPCSVYKGRLTYSPCSRT